VKKHNAEQLLASAWSAALREPVVLPDVVPPDWFTVRGLAEELEVPAPTIQGKIKHLMKSGKAERRLYRVQLQKTLRRVPHYRLKK
jgi:predicted transcriptional regulator